jgi:hypothetical protein
MNPKLDQAVRGQTVIVTWKEIGIDYDNISGFTSLADLQNWCICFGLTLVTNENNTYTISKTV